MPNTRPSAVALVEALRRQAAAFAEHAARRSPRLRALSKARDAVSFSATANLTDLAVPSKLVGVARHQRAVAALRSLRPPFGLALDLVREDVGGRPSLAAHVRATVASGPVAGVRLGFVHDKHVRWLLPLLPLGVELRLTGVTGGGPGRRFGVNVHVRGVGSALRRLAGLRRRAA